MDKLKLNDASLEYLPETSKALGFGFCCGFLGLLHMDMTKERIEREFKIDLIATSPSVIYKVNLTTGETIYIDSPAKLPEKVKIKTIEEPYIKANIFVPATYIGSVMDICQNKRVLILVLSILIRLELILLMSFLLPKLSMTSLNKLKSATKGYASFDYELIGYKVSNLEKMDILLNGEVVDALSLIDLVILLMIVVELFVRI